MSSSSLDECMLWVLTCRTPCRSLVHFSTVHLNIQATVSYPVLDVQAYKLDASQSSVTVTVRANATRDLTPLQHFSLLFVACILRNVQWGTGKEMWFSEKLVLRATLKDISPAPPCSSCSSLSGSRPRSSPSDLYSLLEALWRQQESCSEP